MKIINIIAIAAAKVISGTINTLNLGNATSLPGKIALKISPDIISSYTKQVNEIITVTGTNGKTSTSGFLASILKSDERKIVHNQKGANMLTGVATALLEKSSLCSKIDADDFLFEMDEAYFAKATDYFSPNYILVTNLFRDQLDRYGELDATAAKIQKAIEKSTNPKVILNADDPGVANLNNPHGETIFFGFEEVNFDFEAQDSNSVQEIAYCKCGEKYSYEKVFYAHQGHYYCQHCQNKRPTPQISSTATISRDKSVLTVSFEGRQFEFYVSLAGLYNAYNALGAISTALVLGTDENIIQKGLDSYDTAFGRSEKLVIKDKNVLIQLIKNPVGATEVIKNIDPSEKENSLLVVINDNYADGRDVSWLWDANFELLKEFQGKIIVSGIRASDMAVRLKYAGISPDKIEIIEDIRQAFSKSVEQTQKGALLNIIPTYTALLEIDKIKYL